MPVKTEKDLSDQLRGYWLKAVTAVELRNFGYAISLLQQLLRQEPEFLTGRQMLRRAEATKSNTEKKRFFNIATASFSAIKAQREMKKDPKSAIEMIEKILEDEPYHQQANLLLKEAAVAAGYPEIGIFALQTLLEKKPKDLKVLHQLGRLYHQLEESEKEVEIYNRIAEINPNDLDAIKLGKDASARSSMKRGGWTEAQSYRDLIKDKEMAVSLEQESRMQLTGEALEQQIAEVYARHQTEPQNLDLARRMGMLHEQKDDYDGALAWFQYAVELTQGTDPGLVRKVSDLKMMQLDRKIRAGEELIAQAGGPEEAQNVGELEAAKKQRTELLISDARKRLDRNPTDPQLRYELGEHLASAGHFREAVPELQRARQNPNARLKAMNLLGRCYRDLGMLDLAAKQLEEASKEMLVMDARKKEIVYNLGLVHEQMGDGTKYIECMKQIYATDYGYKDVAQRVESSYAREAEKK
jgi:tetratricopeptide (TPR) repeat protein